MIPLAEALWSYWLTRRITRPGLSRARFERWQARALRHWLDRRLPQVGYYAQAPSQLQDLPIIDKSTLMGAFESFNTAGLSAEAAWAAMEAGGTRGLTVGASTGTSGNRGLFVISEAEKFRWLGAIVAKAIPELLWRRPRVAIILPQDSGLYDSARQSRRIELRFFDLRAGPEAWQDRLEEFAPTVIVAPPKILRHFAETRARLTPQRLFSAAETLDPVDRPVIEAYFGLPLGQIYMATEGLLAVSCAAGGLHLAEDSVFFEFEPVGDGLVSPLITSFRRDVQIMARYRMNDLLRLSDAPCRCGSPLRVIDEVVGRMDDIFRVITNGGQIVITPDILRNAVLDADRRIDDFRVIQQAPDRIELHLPPDLPDPAAMAAEAALQALLAARQAQATVALIRQPLPLDPSRKLRRVECRLGQA